MDRKQQTPQERTEKAHDLIGERALLTGGGGVANVARVVEVLDVIWDSHRAVLDTGEDGIGPDDEPFRPILKSWAVRPLHPDLKETLDPGRYIISGDTIRDAESAGMFGTLHDAEPVAEYQTGDGWVPVDG